MRIAIAFLLLPFFADAQIVRAWPFYTAPEEAAAATNLLLDSFPGAAVAYSLRKLDKDYTGSAIRVRRKSDNTESDIGFSGNYLDTAALKTFAGTGATDTAWVVTWYNQADSSGIFGVRNATMSTAANQPIIVRSGVIIYMGSSPAIRFDGINDYLLTSNYNFSTTSKIFTSSIASCETNNSTRLVIALSDNSTYRSFGGGYFQGTGKFAAQYSTNNTNLPTVTYAFSYLTNTRYLLQNYFDTNNATQNSRIIGYQNNSLIAVDSWSTPAQGNIQANNKPISIGSDGLGNFRLQGLMQEILFYPSDQSANQSAMAANANAFYSIY